MKLAIAFLPLALALSLAVPAMASDKGDIIAVVQAFNAAGNKGDRSGYASFCSADAVMIDHVPPYTFRPPNACAQEYDAVVKGAMPGLDPSSLVQKVLDPVFFEQKGDRAYAVFPLQAFFKLAGRAQIERSYITVGLRQENHRWLIESFVYSSLGWSPNR
jgi:ketosteroid isomerase-like protein